MADPETSSQFVFALTAGAGWAMIAYEGYAQQRGLPVGAWLRGEGTAYSGLNEHVFWKA